MVARPFVFWGLALEGNVLSHQRGKNLKVFFNDARRRSRKKIGNKLWPRFSRKDRTKTSFLEKELGRSRGKESPR